MIDDIVKELLEIYRAKGVVTKDEVLDKIISNNISPLQTERVCNELLSKGALISDNSLFNNKEELYDFDSNWDEKIYVEIIADEPILETLINYIRRIKPPKRNEVEHLFPQIKSGSYFARNRLFEMYMRNALKLAYGEYKELKINLSDAVQDGLRGLWIATEKYSPYEHGKFPAYSYFWIKSTIDVHKKIENSLWDIPNNKLIDVENLYKYLKKYIPSYFENPQLTDSFIKEIADKQQLPLEDAERYLILLAHPLNINLVEVGRHDNGFYKLWLKNVVKKIFATLGEKDSALAEMYYCSSLTYSEIAEKLDVSRERIRQKFIKIDQKVKKEGSRYFDIDPRITEYNF